VTNRIFTFKNSLYPQAKLYIPAVDEASAQRMVSNLTNYPNEWELVEVKG